MSEFLHMGGYALYVWGSYAAALAVFGWNLWASGARTRDLRRRAQAEADRSE